MEGFVIIGIFFAEKGCPQCKKYGFFLHGKPSNSIVLCSNCLHTIQITEPESEKSVKNFIFIQALSEKSRNAYNDSDSKHDTIVPTIDDDDFDQFIDLK
jgi:hypothetical protein